LFLKSTPALILASTSRYRRELLGRLGLAFSCLAPGVDETAKPGEQPLTLVERLAKAKAHAVAMQQAEAWVIGSDQVALLGEDDQTYRILGKPGTEVHCREQLQACSGRTVSFVTAVALMRLESNQLFEFVDTTQVIFRVLDMAAIERYVSREMPLDCAGGFKSEGLGISLCESIVSTDPSALIGLPLIRLSAALRNAGFELP
jgi:septum formation protein